MADEVRQPPSSNVRRDPRLEAAERQQDPRKRRLRLGLIGLFVLAIVGILLAGYIAIFVLPSRELVVRVNDVKYTRGDMVKLLRGKQDLSQRSGGGFNATEDIFLALQGMVEDEIIAQSAPRFGIIVSDEEVDFTIKALLTVGSEGQTPAQREREFQEQYRTVLNRSHLGSAEYELLVGRSILRERFRQFIGESVPTVAEQVHLHRIVMFPEDEIEIMLTRFKDDVQGLEGEELQEAFKVLAREFSRDSRETLRKGGELGWVPEGVLDKYDRVFFDLEVGKLSEPTPDLDEPRQMLVFMVSERAEARDLDARNREVLKTKALQDWLNEERDKYDVYSVFNSEIYAWLLGELRVTSIITPTPVTSPFGF